MYDLITEKLSIDKISHINLQQILLHKNIKSINVRTDFDLIKEFGCESIPLCSETKPYITIWIYTAYIDNIEDCRKTFLQIKHAFSKFPSMIWKKEVLSTGNIRLSADISENIKINVRILTSSEIRDEIFRCKMVESTETFPMKTYSCPKK